jgi:hypothetical protein
MGQNHSQSIHCDNGNATNSSTNPKNERLDNILENANRLMGYPQKYRAPYSPETPTTTANTPPTISTQSLIERNKMKKVSTELEYEYPSVLGSLKDQFTSTFDYDRIMNDAKDRIREKRALQREEKHTQALKIEKPELFYEGEELQKIQAQRAEAKKIFNTIQSNPNAQSFEQYVNSQYDVPVPQRMKSFERIVNEQLSYTREELDAKGYAPVSRDVLIQYYERARTHARLKILREEMRKCYRHFRVSHAVACRPIYVQYLNAIRLVEGFSSPVLSSEEIADFPAYEYPPGDPLTNGVKSSTPSS